MLNQPSEAERWQGYYAAQTGRGTRPLFDEALPRLGEAGVGRLAVDLGCGDGTETLALLARGWRVLAVDKQPEALALLNARVRPEHQSRLETRLSAFEDLPWPACDLVYAGYSLPFTPPAHFAAVWAGLTTALGPAGWLVGQLFGERDSWKVDSAMTFQARVEALALLAPFEVQVFREREEDGPAFSGPKHWHIFDVIARKRSPA